MSNPSTPPAGFYDDGNGRQRWYDGTQWTDRFAEPQQNSGVGSKIGGLLKDRVKSVSSGVKSSTTSAVSEAGQNVASAGSAIKSSASDSEVRQAVSSADAATPLYEVMSHIDGKNAKVRLWPDRLEWERPRGVSGAKVTAGILTGGASLLLTGVKGGKDAYEMIPLKQLTSVSNRKDGMLYHLVEVQSAGGTVGFRVSRDQAAQFRQAILDQLAALSSTSVVVQIAAPAGEVAPVLPDHVTQLQQLAQLHEAGILTDDEFNAKKTEILSRM